MAYNLGTAYINITPKMDGAGRQIEKELAGVGDRAGSSRGGGLGGKLWGGLKKSAAGAGIAIGGVLAGSVAKGFQRLSAIEQAEAKLSGLGHNAESVESIMTNALASVKGTAFGLDEAAGLAGTLVASGIKPGEELEKTLRLTADSATIAGRELGDMGLIWGSVAAKGKLQGDDAMQLLASGVPIWQMVGDVMGVTAAEAQELGSKGEVSFDIFRQAMEQGVGGAALEAGNTTQGAFKNMGAAMGRFGAALLKDVYPLVGPVLNKITDLFDYLTDAAGPVLEQVSGKIATFGEALGGIWDILVKGDFTGGIFGIEEDHPFVGFLFTVREAAIELWERALLPLGNFIRDNIIPIFAGLGAGALYAGITAVVGAIGGAIAAAGGLSAVIGAAVGAIAWVPLAIGAAIAALVWFFRETEAGQAIFEKIVSFVRDTLVPGIVGAFTAVKDFIVEELWPMIKSRFEAVRDLAVQVWQGVVQPAFEQFVGFLRDTVFPIIQRLWQEYIQPAFVAIGGAAVWMWENAIKPAWSAFNDFLTNVLGPVIVWLWQNVVSPIFGLIGKFIGWVWNTLIFPYLDLMKYYFTVVLPAVFKFLWEVAKQVWSGISAAISAVVDWITGTAVPFIKAAWDLIAGSAKWLWGVFVAVWNGIKGAVQAVVSWFRTWVWPVLEMVIKLIQIGFNALKSALQTVWNSIRDSVIKPVVSWFQNTAWPLIKKVIEAIKLGFNVMRDALKAAWQFVKDNVISPVVNWFKNVAWPILRSAIDSVKTGFNAMRDSIKNAWKYVQDKAIQPVMNWLTGTVKPKIDTLTDNITDAFSTMKDSVLKAWEKIKDGMKSPINGIIRIYNKHVKGNFDGVAEKLGLDTRLPTMNEFATGGYTGPGSKYTPAGVVHADEYVIRKESQNDLRRKAPGFLDSLNRHGARALGYAKGGLVKLGAPFAGSYPRGDGFGARNGRHKGIDWPMPSGAVLKAVGSGSVRHTRNPSAGKKLELTLGNGLVAGYHHLSSFIAKNGSSVGGGADVARVGSTGRSSGPHLHFSLKRDGKYVDPAPYLGGGGSAGSGDGGGGWWNPFDGLWSKIKGEVSKAVGGGWIGDVLTKTASNTVGWAKDWVFDKIGDVGDWGMEQVDSAGRAVKTARWLPVAKKALNMEGELSESNLNSLMRRMNQESGMNPRAINNWDSNAKKGTPSKGLMQVIDPTFRAYARPGYNKDIWDPLSNILASIRYARSAYGSPARGWDRKGGYADGGLVKPFLHDSGGWHEPGKLSINQTRKPEAVLTNGQWASISSLVGAVRDGRSGDTWNVYGPDAREVAREVEVRRRRREALYAV